MSSGSSSPDHSLDYCYPQAPVHQSLAEVDLNTLMMRSNSRRLPEEASSSLDESSYEILGDDMIDTSDDEGHTESLASTDGLTPDDSGFSSDEDDEAGVIVDGDYGAETYPHTQPANQTTHPASVEDSHITSPGDSMMTSTADPRGGEYSYHELEEHPFSRDGATHATCTLSTYDKASGMPPVLVEYGRPEVRLTLQLGLSPRLLPMTRSFRILYVGHFEEWAKQDVNRQIGAALNATPSSSRFNIVQDDGFPGSASSSKVQLERSYSEIVNDHCPAPKQVGQSLETPVSITLDDGSELILDEFEDPAWDDQRFPDLVVFCHSSGFQTSTEETLFYATREIVSRQDIPFLDLSVVRQYHGKPWRFRGNTVHLRIEGRKEKETEMKLLQEIPVDVWTFLNIDPTHLNRHLAYLHERSGSGLSRGAERGSENRKSSESTAPFQIILKRPAFAIDGHPISWQRCLEVIGKVLLTAGFWWAIYTYAIPTFTLYANRGQPTTAAVPSIVSATAAHTTPVLHHSADATSSILSTPPSIPSSIIPSVSRAVASRAPKPMIPKDEAFGPFSIETTGEHQFVLRTNKEASRGRRKLLPQVSVQKGAETVPVHVKRSSDGVFTVDLAHEYTASLFNVTVVSQRKPLSQQSFVITLGIKEPAFSSMLEDLDRLSRSLIRDVAVAQTTLKNLSVHVSQGLQGALIKFEGGALSTLEQTRHWGRQLQDRTQNVGESVGEHLQQAKEEAARRLEVGAKTTKEVSEALQKSWQEYSVRVYEQIQKLNVPDVREQARPVAGRARKNAKALQKKLQKKTWKPWKPSKQDLASKVAEKMRTRCKAGKKAGKSKACKKR